jgi:hypothetical protein
MHTHEKISFIPPEAILLIWQQDYELMRKNMIYGEAKEFKDLIKKLQQLIERFRNAG